ncbi:MAG: FtsK/SpoIIIE domain-containing protein [Filomicrobium sp.]
MRNTPNSGAATSAAFVLAILWFGAGFFLLDALREFTAREHVIDKYYRWLGHRDFLEKFGVTSVQPTQYVNHLLWLDQQLMTHAIGVVLFTPGVVAFLWAVVIGLHQASQYRPKSRPVVVSYSSSEEQPFTEHVRQYLRNRVLLQLRWSYFQELFCCLVPVFKFAVAAALAAYIGAYLASGDYGLAKVVAVALCVAILLTTPLWYSLVFHEDLPEYPADNAGVDLTYLRHRENASWRHFLLLLRPKYWTDYWRFVALVAPHHSLRGYKFEIQENEQLPYIVVTEHDIDSTYPRVISRHDNTPGLLQRYAAGSVTRRELIRQQYLRSLPSLHPSSRGYSEFDISAISPDGKLLYLPVAIGADSTKDNFDFMDLEQTDHAAQRYVFRSERKAIDVDHWQSSLPQIEAYLGGRWRVQKRDGASLMLYRLPEVPESFPLEPQFLRPGEIFFGLDLNTAQPVYLPWQKLTHTLIAGPSGFGKSVFLHQMMASVVTNFDQFESIYLVDLKFGLELKSYPSLSGKFNLTRTPEEVPALTKTLLAEMERRGKLMDERNLTHWDGPLILIVIDEFADVLLSQPKKGGEGGKTNVREEVERDLVRLTNLSRALGFRFWVQSQKTTTDAVPSAFRHNLSTVISFRMPSNMSAANLYGDAQDMPADITKLKRGQAIYRDGRTSEMVAVQGAYVEFEDVARFCRTREAR